MVNDSNVGGSNVFSVSSGGNGVIGSGIEGLYGGVDADVVDVSSGNGNAVGVCVNQNDNSSNSSNKLEEATLTTRPLSPKMRQAVSACVPSSQPEMVRCLPLRFYSLSFLLSFFYCFLFLFSSFDLNVFFVLFFFVAFANCGHPQDS